MHDFSDYAFTDNDIRLFINLLLFPRRYVTNEKKFSPPALCSRPHRLQSQLSYSRLQIETVAFESLSLSLRDIRRFENVRKPIRSTMKLSPPITPRGGLRLVPATMMVCFVILADVLATDETLEGQRRFEDQNSIRTSADNV